MNPFQAVLFLIFVLPAVMLKHLWKMLFGEMTEEEKKKIIWKIPYILLIALIVLVIVLWMHGYR